MIPNLLLEVEACKTENPVAWANAHTGNAQTDDFIKLLAARCHAIDPRFGNNGKRGNPLDISDDALCFKGEGTDFDPTDGNAPRTVIDVIGAAGSPNASPQWAIVTKPSAPVGAAWVKPGASVPVPIPQPPHVCPAPFVPSREEALDELNWLDGYYKSPEGLQRPQGLSLDGKPDFLGIAAWYLDVYQSQRVGGKSRAESRAAYVKSIRHTDEWKQKHPGETP